MRADRHDGQLDLAIAHDGYRFPAISEDVLLLLLDKLAVHLPIVQALRVQFSLLV